MSAIVPPVPDLPDQVLYAETQYDDVEAALAVLEERMLLPCVAAGRCSGGYLAFSCLIKDHRIAGACLANPFVFYWDPRRKVEDSLAVVPRSLDTYTHRLFQVQTLRRMMRGDVDVKNAVRNFAIVGARRALNRLGLSHAFSREARLERRRSASLLPGLPSARRRWSCFIAITMLGLITSISISALMAQSWRTTQM